MYTVRRVFDRNLTEIRKARPMTPPISCAITLIMKLHLSGNMPSNRVIVVLLVHVFLRAMYVLLYTDALQIGTARIAEKSPQIHSKM